MIEKASGVGFEAYMRRYVWEPAGMVSSSFDVPERVVHRRGWGYERTARGVIRKAAYVDVSYKYASGGMLASCEDLVRFAAAINAGTLMKAETRHAMHAVQVESVMAYQAKGAPVKQDFKQAIGWRVSTDVTGRTYISHTGTVRGTRSVVINYPAEAWSWRCRPTCCPSTPRPTAARSRSWSCRHRARPSDGRSSGRADAGERQPPYAPC